MRYANLLSSRPPSTRILLSLFTLVGVWGGTVLLPGNAGALTLDQYLDQVRRNNLGYLGATQQSEAAALGTREADLVTSPSFFANAQNTYEAKKPIVSALQYDHLEMQNYSLGVMQQFEFGLQGKLSYAIDRTGYVGSNLAPMGSGGYAYDARPVLEVSIPLWQNFGGRTTKATSALARRQGEAQRFAADAQARALLVQAESSYWRLAVAREVVNIQSRALQQAEAIQSYVTTRANKNLGEKADVLQANALVAARRFELKRARDEEFAALHAFNTTRQGSVVEQIDQLDKVDFAALEKIPVQATRPGDRADTMAAKSQADAAAANATIQEDKYRPKLELFGSYAMNGQDEASSKAVQESWSSDAPTNAVGLRLSVPLNRGATASVQRSAALARNAAKMQYEQKVYQQDSDWQDLVRRIGEAKESLKLTQTIEAAQEAKITAERQRLREGRTTTYQILLFEQDYSQAELAHMQAAAQVLTLIPQTKLYMTSHAEEAQP